MKKTFPLRIPGKEDKRVLEIIKLELTKYVKRERKKTLPPEMTVWDFQCRVGSGGATASAVAFPDLMDAVDAVALAGSDEVYVEILASPGYREKKNLLGTLPTPGSVKITSAVFQGSSPDLASCPKSALPEFALIGRSNVGKSSLINMLTRSEGLAKVSHILGKTRLINFFTINGAWNLVDLPGYGYAKVGRQERGAFSAFVSDYLRNRTTLGGTFVLIDARHAPQSLDLEFVEWMVVSGLAFILAFTKSDALSATAAQRNIEAFLTRMREFTEEAPAYVLTSSKDDQGRMEILRLIGSALSEQSEASE